MKGGPKTGVLSDLPLWLDDLPPGGGRRVFEFCRKYLSPTEGTGAGRPLVLRPWQRNLVNGVYDEPRPRSGLWSLPRGNGKSSLAAALAVFSLFGDGEYSPQVLLIATSLDQAGRIVFRTARDMIFNSRPLADRAIEYADRIVVPSTNGILVILPSEPSALVGYNPSLAIIDEVGLIGDDIFEAVLGASGKRERSLVLSIGTPSEHRAGPMWRMVERGRAGADPSMAFAEFAAPDGCAIDDVEAWKIANPATTGPRPFLHIDAMASSMLAMRESRFRRDRLGQWVDGESTWLPWDLWAARTDTKRSHKTTSAKYVLGFDGSYSGDSTAVVACTLDQHLSVLGLWEDDGSDGWTVDRHSVEACVLKALADPNCIAMYADPPLWRAELESWSKRWPRKVFEWPTHSRQRMGPATDRFRQAVMQGSMTHDGNQRLAIHIANSRAEPSEFGDLIRKEHRRSPKKIDAAVASIVALDRAAWHASQTQRSNVLRVAN